MFPLLAFKNNIVFNNKGEAYAVYKLASFPYNHLPQKKKKEVIKIFEEFLYGLEGKGQILFLNEELYLTEDEYIIRSSLPLNDVTREHITTARQSLISGARQRRKYLVIELNINIIEEGIKTLLEEFRDHILKTFLRVNEWTISGKQVRHALEKEEEFYRKIQHIIDRRANFADLDFIIRRCTKRVGTLPLPLPSRDADIFTPALLAALSEGSLIQEHTAHVTVTSSTEKEKHYQTFIVFADISKSVEQIGSEWLASLDALSTSVDAAVHFEVMSSHKAAKKIARRRQILRGQMQEVAEADEVSIDEEEGYEISKVLESKVKSGQPLASMAVTLAIANKDIKQLRADAKKITERFTAYGHRAVRPIGDQIKCFYSFIPGSETPAPKIECDPGYIAASGPNISLEVGDGTGCLLGWCGTMPVFWKPGYAARELSRSNAWLITGSLGGGKSVLMKYLLYLTYISGGHLFIIDPKNNEYGVFDRLFPVQNIDLCPGGKSQINPLTLAKNEKRAKDTAYNYLSIILNIQDDNRRIAVFEALERTFKLPIEERNMHAYVKTLKELGETHEDEKIRREAHVSYLLLDKIRKGDLGHIIFGTQKTEIQHRITIANLQDLPLPRTAEGLKTSLSDSERQGLGILYLTAAMAREIAFSLSTGITKAIGFDEAWMLLNIREGRIILDEIVRMASRTYGAIMIMATQNATDIDIQTLKNNVGYAACFKSYDQAEIQANLELLGTETTGNTLSEMFPNLKPGWCIMRDAYGRIGRVYIYPCPQKLVQVFDTSPKDGKAEKTK